MTPIVWRTSKEQQIFLLTKASMSTNTSNGLFKKPSIQTTSIFQMQLSPLLPEKCPLFSTSCTTVPNCKFLEDLSEADNRKTHSNFNTSGHLSSTQPGQQDEYLGRQDLLPQRTQKVYQSFTEFNLPRTETSNLR